MHPVQVLIHILALISLSATAALMWSRSRGFRDALEPSAWFAPLWATSAALTQLSAWVSTVSRLVEGYWPWAFVVPFVGVLGIAAAWVFRDLRTAAPASGAPLPAEGHRPPLISVRSVKFLAVGTVGYSISWVLATVASAII